MHYQFFHLVVQGLQKKFRRRPDDVAHALLKVHPGRSACAKYRAFTLTVEILKSRYISSQKQNVSQR